MTTDRTGAGIFDAGVPGEAHVRAHRAFATHSAREGYAQLAWVLARPHGTGPQWTHLEWHQLVFELELGKVDAARARYHRAIAPAVTRGWALTDGPQALWRLALAAPERPLDWSEVHRVAVERLANANDPPFVVWHHLLAVTGAGDEEALCRFVGRRSDTLGAAAQGLLAWLRGEDARLAHALAQLDPQVGPWAGSEAQNTLLADLAACPRIRRQAA